VPQTVPRSTTAFGFAGSLPQQTLVVPALLAVWYQIWQRIQQTASTDTGLADLAPASVREEEHVGFRTIVRCRVASEKLLFSGRGSGMGVTGRI